MDNVKRYCGKLGRFFLNPKPYFQVAWYRYVMKRLVWPLQVMWIRKICIARNVARISKKDKIHVVFLAMSVAYWKYDTVYRRMAKDTRFKVTIFPALRRNQSLRDQLKEYDELMEVFGGRGYNIVESYDRATGKFLSLKALNPDIVFYTHPYSGPGRILRKYDFWSMRKALLCFEPYYYALSSSPSLHNNPLQNACWKMFYPSEYHHQRMSKVLDNGGVNVCCSGYVFGEEMLETSKEDADNAWKNDQSGRKRLIWAPHHSIDFDSVYRASTFLEYCDFMKEIAIAYKDKIMIAFKPHPVLYSRLIKSWGCQKVDDYYNFWATKENTMLHEADYLALFKGSDGLIHDSASFQAEYMYVNKPAIFLYRRDFLYEAGGKIVEDVHAAHYAGHSKSDIVHFIDDVVVGGDDPKKSVREQFFNTYLCPPNGRPFSENVVDEILKGLGKLS